jgi:hypothetical protein
MKTVTELSLKEGGTILIETEPPSARTGAVRVSKDGEILDRTQVQLETALTKIRPVASAIVSALNRSVDAPAEIAVEFGIKLSAEANVVISSTAVEGSFKISLKWKH